MVVVHTEKRARAGAARSGAQTHHIHAFTVHPRGAQSRGEGSTDGAFDVFVPKEWEKDQSGARGEDRAEGEGRLHIFITKLMEEEEEGRPSKACPGPSDLLAPRTPELHANFHSGLCAELISVQPGSTKAPPQVPRSLCVLSRGFVGEKGEQHLQTAVYRAVRGCNTGRYR